MTKSAIAIAATTNTDVINNLILILENMKLDPEIDNYDDIKKLMSKATNVAIKESRKTTTKTTKTKAIKPIKVDVDKKKRTNPYIDYIKEKMPEMKDEPKGTKLTAIRQMWSIEKAFTALN
jgi:hypothetical protein